MSSLSPIGRVAFPSVYKATAMEEDQKPKYGLILIFEPDNMDAAEKALFTQMIQSANTLSLEEHKAPLKAAVPGRPEKFVRSPFRRGEEKPDLDGFGAGKIFVRFATLEEYGAPNVVDQQKSPITEASGRFYPGCYAHVTYNLFAYSKGGNYGVAFGLNNIQKTADGESFGVARGSVEDDFGVVGAVTGSSELSELADIPF